MSRTQDVVSFELPSGILGVTSIRIPVSAVEGSISEVEGNRIILLVGPDLQNGYHHRVVQIVHKHARPTKLPDVERTSKIGTFRKGMTNYCIFLDTSKAID